MPNGDLTGETQDRSMGIESLNLTQPRRGRMFENLIDRPSTNKSVPHGVDQQERDGTDMVVSRVGDGRKADIVVFVQRVLVALCVMQPDDRLEILDTGGFFIWQIERYVAPLQKLRANVVSRSGNVPTSCTEADDQDDAQEIHERDIPVTGPISVVVFKPGPRHPGHRHEADPDASIPPSSDKSTVRDRIAKKRLYPGVVLRSDFVSLSFRIDESAI